MAESLHLILGTLYSSVDVRYSDTKDIVTMSTGRVMVIEIVLNFIAVFLVKYPLPLSTTLVFALERGRVSADATQRYFMEIREAECRYRGT